MNNPFRSQGRDRQPDRATWSEQGQDGGYYGEGRSPSRAAQDWGRDGEQGRYGASAQYGRDEGYRSQSDFGPPRDMERDRGYSQPRSDYDRPHWGRQDGGGAFDAGRRDDYATRYGYEQPRSQGSSYVAGRYEDYGRREPWQNASRPQQPSQSDYEPDYLHWREQQMAAYDRDYDDWRNEKRQKFSSDFDSWRSSRGPRVQADNSVVGDVTDGGGGSQTHAKAVHGDDKPAKH